MDQLVTEIVIYTLAFIPIAIGVAWLVPKFGGTPWPWLVLCFVPVVNYYIVFFVLVRAAGIALDRLAALDRRVEDKLDPFGNSPSAAARAPR